MPPPIRGRVHRTFHHSQSAYITHFRMYFVPLRNTHPQYQEE